MITMCGNLSQLFPQFTACSRENCQVLLFLKLPHEYMISFRNVNPWSLPGVMVVKGNRSAPSHCQSMDDNTGLCKKNSCKNGGCCAVLSETHFQCLCAHGFKGTLCEEAVSTLEEIAITLSNSYVTTVIAICSLVAVAFLYLSGKAVRRHRIKYYNKRRRARYSKQLKAPKEPKTLSTETNL
ncbi:hypothetical protein T12_570 [Trichinella patagoniensis]|uniref:EGF-like domain-containing protein n=1 Tax=Trichinella patagoniensis TaxID=990121 RepID=A0A0V0ZMP2_9BILA|nr:hypothetical protein T12_570 [Trichinella patagoniensis]